MRRFHTPARVAKLVDAGDSKSPAARRVGSSPTPGTKHQKAALFKAAFSMAGIRKDECADRPKPMPAHSVYHQMPWAFTLPSPSNLERAER